MLPWSSWLHALMWLTIGLIGGLLALASWITGERSPGWWVTPLGGLVFVLIATHGIRGLNRQRLVVMNRESLACEGEAIFERRQVASAGVTEVDMELPLLAWAGANLLSTHARRLAVVLYAGPDQSGDAQVIWPLSFRPSAAGRRKAERAAHNLQDWASR
jgi:hypothetical protein